MNPLQREFDRIRKSKPRQDLRKRTTERRKAMRQRSVKWEKEHPTRLALPHRNDYDQRLDSVQRVSTLTYVVFTLLMAAIVIGMAWYGLVHGAGLV